MILLSESAKEKRERERFLGQVAPIKWVSKTDVGSMFPRFEVLPFQQQLLGMIEGCSVTRVILKGRSPGLSTCSQRHREKMMRLLWPTSLKKTFKRSEAAKACRMAIDVFSDEWLDKQFGGAK